MSTSKIEWTEKTWNPVTGCNKVSAGCKNCYAEVMHKRLRVLMPEKYAHDFLEGAFPYEKDLLLPLKWKKPCRIFVNSMSDLFHKDVPFDFIDKVFAVMTVTPQHTYQILTKRPERMVEYFKSRTTTLQWGAAAYETFGQLIAEVGEIEYPLRNVWLGTSVEDQATADERIPELQTVPATVRFLSCEPLLGPIDLRMDTRAYLGEGEIHWVIAGGESGHRARPMHPDWVRSLRDQCKTTGVPFFFKQWGEWTPVKFGQRGSSGKNIGYFNFCGQWISGENVNEEVYVSPLNMRAVGKKESGRLLDGIEWNEYPQVKEVTA
jgi:protein gp37